MSAFALTARSPTAASPPARLSVVSIHWAARDAFHMTERDAAEHVLQIRGTNLRPDREVHIGALAHHGACAVAFDLSPGSGSRDDRARDDKSRGRIGSGPSEDHPGCRAPGPRNPLPVQCCSWMTPQHDEAPRRAGLSGGKVGNVETGGRGMTRAPHAPTLAFAHYFQAALDILRKDAEGPGALLKRVSRLA
jgi:hypothetical protein